MTLLRIFCVWPISLPLSLWKEVYTLEYKQISKNERLPVFSLTLNKALLMLFGNIWKEEKELTTFHGGKSLFGLMKGSLKKRYIRDETVAGIETQFREHLKSSTDVSSIMLWSLQKTNWQTTLKCPVISPDTHLKARGRESWWIEERYKVFANHKSFENQNVM